MPVQAFCFVLFSPAEFPYAVQSDVKLITLHEIKAECQEEHQHKDSPPASFSLLIEMPQIYGSFFYKNTTTNNEELFGIIRTLNNIKQVTASLFAFISC